MAMDEKKLAEELRQEGFRRSYVWQDGPNAFYAEHVHSEETAHVILSGAMTLIIGPYRPALRLTRATGREVPSHGVPAGRSCAIPLQRASATGSQDLR